MSNPWLSLIIQKGNKAGVIPSAPQGLQNLKEAIKGVPFQLLQKGMSGVMDVNNIMQGVAQFAQQLGSLSQLGNFTNILGQFKGLASSLPGIAQLNVNTLTSQLNTSALVAAMGPNQAMMAGLTQFAPVALLQNLNTDAGQPSGANINNVQDAGTVQNNATTGSNDPTLIA
jgi:hypothetical protein